MSCLNNGYRISKGGEGTKSERSLDGSDLSLKLLLSSSFMKSIISSSFWDSFSGVETLLERLVFREAAVSGKVGRGMEEGSSVMVN